MNRPRASLTVPIGDGWTRELNHFERPCQHFVENDLTEVLRAFKGLGVR